MTRALVIVVLSLLLISCSVGLSPPIVHASGTIHSPIYINGDQSFTPANGVTGGNGSSLNPYIIQGWNITQSGSFGEITLIGTTAHVIIRNVFLNDAGGCSGGDGVFLWKVTNVVIANSTIENASDGIYVATTTNITISGNTIDRNCLAIESGQWAYGNPSFDISIINNTIIGNGNGVYFHYDSNVTFVSNTVAFDGTGGQFFLNYAQVVNNSFVSDGLWGLIVQGDGSRVTGNAVYSNGDGITVNGNHEFVAANTSFSNSRGIIVSGNNDTISKNYVQLNSGNGLVVQGSGDRIDSNYASRDSGSGISLQSSTNTTITGNDMYKDGTGLTIGSSDQTLVYHNNFLSNTVQISATSVSKMSLNSTYPAAGNFWSNYAGVDRCSGPLQNVCTGPDGIGDTPVVVPTSSGSPPVVTGTVQDYYPLIRQFGASSDTPPVWPVGNQITTSNTSFYSTRLSWTPAFDDTGVVAYQLYENGTLLASVPQSTPSFVVTGLTPSDTYLFRVLANDTAGLESTVSPSLVFVPPETLPAPQPPASAEVVIRDSVSGSASFDPATLTINQGQTVTWCNAGISEHTVIFSSSSKYTLIPVYQSNGDPCIYLTFYNPGTSSYYDVLSGATGTIVALPVPANFSISPNPSKLISFSSSPGLSTITITRFGNFTGTVNLSLSISPSGLTCSLSSDSFSLAFSTIVGLSCLGPSGTYNVTITGSSGKFSQSATLVYSDRSPPGPSPGPSPPTTQGGPPPNGGQPPNGRHIPGSALNQTSQLVLSVLNLIARSPVLLSGFFTVVVLATVVPVLVVIYSQKKNRRG